MFGLHDGLGEDFRCCIYCGSVKPVSDFVAYQLGNGHSDYGHCCSCVGVLPKFPVFFLMGSL